MNRGYDVQNFWYNKSCKSNGYNSHERLLK